MTDSNVARKSAPTHWIQRIIIIISAVLGFFLLCLWAWTSVIDNINLSVWTPLDLSVNFHHGGMQWERTYAFKNEIPMTQFHSSTPPAQRVVPRISTMLWFWYSSGHEKGYAEAPLNGASDPTRVLLAYYWICVMPIWPVFLLVSSPFIIWFISWYRMSKKQSQIGFEVVGRE